MQDPKLKQEWLDMPAPASLAELGARLRSAREASGWPVDESAQKLHLPVATLGDLEAGRSDRIGTPIYLKGFLRSYLKLLGMPERWADDAINGSAAVEVPPILPAAGAVARRVSWLERYKWAASYVVGTALALTAVHWLVSNTPQLGFPDAQRTTVSVPASTQTTPPQPPAPAIAGEALGPVTPAATVQDELPVVASLSPFPRSTEASPVEPVPAAPAALELVVTRDSWIQVRGSGGTELLKAIVRAGERRSFSDGGPFSVNIGNVGGVTATVGGAPVDLATYARGNVARFDVTDKDGTWRAQARHSEASAASSDEG